MNPTGVEPARRSYLRQHGGWCVSRFTTGTYFIFPLPQVSLHPRVYFLRWDSIPTIRFRHFTREACISSITEKYYMLLPLYKGLPYWESGSDRIRTCVSGHYPAVLEPLNYKTIIFRVSPSNKNNITWSLF